MSKNKLDHIPGKAKYPILGDTLSFILGDPIDNVNAKRAKYGDIYKTRIFGNDNVVIIKPDATKWILLDHAKDFHSKEPWESVLKELFPNGLMLMDGDQHKFHRAIIAEVFKKEPMEGYLSMMIPIIEDWADSLPEGGYKMFHLFKELTLNVALKVFFGLNPADKLNDINQSITDIVKASAALHIRLPFTKYGKGIKARKRLIEFFSAIIDDKRSNPSEDLFSKLCTARSEDGEQFSDEQVIDHLIFILMAAHDTTASTLTSLSYFLAKNEDWQNDIRNEARALFSKSELSQMALRKMEKSSLATKETLRIYPPLTSIGRKSTKELKYGEYIFPPDTFFSVAVSYHQLNPEIWDNPNIWDPNRFNSTRSEDKRCPYAYSPFGAGLHHCIGYAFAEMQIHLLMGKLLDKFRLKVPNGYEIPMRAIPLHEPKDGLPMTLEKIDKG